MDELDRLIHKELQRHRPVEGHLDRITFECEYNACVCGNWTGPGSLFECHRAQAVAAIVADMFAITR